MVRETVGGLYSVRTPDGREVSASLRGRLKRDARALHRVVVGDRVRLARAGEAWTVADVEERSNAILRRGPGGRRPRVVAANLDRALVVVAAAEPDPHPVLVDRLLAVAEAGGVAPVLVVNKLDLPRARARADELEALYTAIRYPVLRVSARTGEGVERLADLVSSGTSAVIGPSGAGKSALLNAVQPGLGLRTGALSARTARGRHTTVGARLLDLERGGSVVDTPGLGDVSLWDVPVNEVARCFPEIHALANGCRFRGCAHVEEPECAVRAALERDEVPPTRYASYLALRRQARG